MHFIRYSVYVDAKNSLSLILMLLRHLVFINHLMFSRKLSVATWTNMKNKYKALSKNTTNIVYHHFYMYALSIVEHGASTGKIVSKNNKKWNSAVCSVSHRETRRHLYLNDFRIQREYFQLNVKTTAFLLSEAGEALTAASLRTQSEPAAYTHRYYMKILSHSTPLHIIQT